jgi:hypothetical protein
MTPTVRRESGAETTVVLGRPPEFDAAAAAALAVVTLLTSGLPHDAEMAGGLLAELMAAPAGERFVVRGLASVCAGLLALLEFYGGVPPASGLRELGRLIAQANTLS